MEHKKMEVYKGEKYIYLLMAFKLAQLNKNKISIGHDNLCVGGQNYYREFKIQIWKGKTLLIETKLSSASADFSRTFEILNSHNKKPSIMDYMNEDFENCGQTWTH